jgi:hypothetical protein
MFELQCENYKNATTAVNDKHFKSSKNGLYITSPLLVPAASNLTVQTSK